MVTSHSFPEAPADLPPRTWRQWWNQLPKWLRIGLWAIFAVLFIHLALILFIASRIREPSAIRTLRSHGHDVSFPWDHGDPQMPVPPLRILDDIYHGRTCANIEQIVLIHATDADLAICSRYFPNLKGLYVTHGDQVSKQGLLEILKCRNLTRLELSGPAVDDNFVKQLSELKNVESLGLSGTLITDASVATLQDMPKLSEVNLQCTHVSQTACQDWHARVPGYQGTPGAPALRSDYNPINLKEYGTKVVVCWRNDQLTDLESYTPITKLGRGGYIRLQAVGPLPDESKRFEHVFDGTRRLIFKGDGDYRLTLKIDDLESDPITSRAEGGKLIAPSRVELRMPVTELEVMNRSGN